MTNAKRIKLTQWQLAHISNLLDRECAKETGDQFYRDCVSELANLIGKARYVTVTE